MVVGLAIQTIMAPFNLIENACVKAIILGNGFKQDDKIFEEKTASELTPDDEVVDDSGNPITGRQIGAAAAAAASASSSALSALIRRMARARAKLRSMKKLMTP